MEKVTNFEEFKTEYLKTHNWVIKYYKTEEKLQKELLATFKRYNMYRTGDNLLLFLDNKAPISSDMYYDDEMDTPEKSENNFIDYNLRLNFKYDMGDYIKQVKDFEATGCCSGALELSPYYVIRYENNREMVTPIFYNYNDRRTSDIARGYFVREMTKEEVQEYIAICEELKENYIARSKAYFKKYGKNIHAIGYWRDR